MILLFFAFCLFSVVVYTLTTGISPAPTGPKIKKRLLAELPSDVEGPIYELGCGWGGLAVALAKHYSKGTVIAYELSPIPYLVSWLRALLIPNLTVVRADFFKRPLFDASLVTCYLSPKLMEKLTPKLSKEMMPGAWVASHTFSIRSWKALKEVQVEDLLRTPIYLYAPN